MSCSYINVMQLHYNFFVIVFFSRQVQATDADQGENGRVLYRIITGKCCLPVLLQKTQINVANPVVRNGVTKSFPVVLSSCVYTVPVGSVMTPVLFALHFYLLVVLF